MSGMVIINPGSGPVLDATEKNAIDNIKHWITDCGIKDLEFLRLTENDSDGRFCFLVWKDTRCHEIDMPGLPLEKVRYVSDEQSIWNFPRLYVDGSSWVWKFSLLDEKDFKEPEED